MALSIDNAAIDDPVMTTEWFVVARSADLEDGKAIPAKLLGIELVLWRSVDKVMAWRDLCVHRGTRLSIGEVKDGRIICPYHGWNYDTAGACKHIPAMPNLTPPVRARAHVYKAKEQYGFIWVCIGEPKHDIPPFPEWSEDAYRKQIVGPYEFHANPFRTIENFTDIPHFPHVHPMINGDPSRPDIIEDYDVTLDEDGLKMSPIDVWQPFADHRGVPAMARYRYSIFRPLSAYFSKDTGEGNMFCMMLTATPLAEDECLVWLLVAINFGDEVTEEQIIDRQNQVFAQDKWIVESQRPPGIPLDIQDELHLRCDKYSVAYRRWLKELGLTWGVAS
jgi:phenylpropionate dioxygenase-like ring-hydroxylating dioxygenase large terminal subunit